MYVVLDANVLAADYKLESRALNAVLELRNRGHATVVIPEIVVLEVCNAWRRAVEATIHAFKKQVARLGGFAPRLANDDAATAAIEYETWLRNKLSNFNIEIAGHPDVSHSRLVSRAIARRKPFGEDSRGYRDALIWEIILRLISDDDVVFITNNTRDFGDGKDGLARDLLEDIQDSAYNERSVRLFITARDAFAALIEPLDQAIEKVRKRLENGVFRKSLADQIASVAEADLDVRSSTNRSNTYVPDNAEFDGLARLFAPYEIAVTNAWRLQDDTIEVEFEAEADADVDYTVSESANSYHRSDFEPFAWEIDLDRGSGSATVTASVHVTALLDNDELTGVTARIYSIDF